ncbi:hypothetical protein PLESTB_000123500 [Pleodorina starrii]|uniref:Uncharacterized protein n=1 Tax=Pleodorina starrii TaxID=330485 RepID=A0A9W6BBD8_9CHLO|nr:hypothetical protein PLESTB_000123500 [Pleodorina starrii]
MGEVVAVAAVVEAGDVGKVARVGAGEVEGVVEATAVKGAWAAEGRVVWAAAERVAEAAMGRVEREVKGRVAAVEMERVAAVEMGRAAEAAMGMAAAVRVVMVEGVEGKALEGWVAASRGSCTARVDGFITRGQRHRRAVAQEPCREERCEGGDDGGEGMPAARNQQRDAAGVRSSAGLRHYWPPAAADATSGGGTTDGALAREVAHSDASLAPAAIRPAKGKRRKSEQTLAQAHG